MAPLRRSIFELIPKPLQPAVWRVVEAWRLAASAHRSELHTEMSGRRAFFRRAFKALAFNGIDGDYVEFGSCSGMTLALAHRESRRAKLRCKLWTFDSFRGFPAARVPADDHPAWRAHARPVTLEAFHRVCRLRSIPRSDYEVVAGFYADTLRAPATSDLPQNICLAYIDCDLYSSTRDVLAFLVPRLKHGMVIALDDYYCWSATQAAGERRALAEALGQSEVWHAETAENTL